MVGMASVHKKARARRGAKIRRGYDRAGVGSYGKYIGARQEHKYIDTGWNIDPLDVFSLSTTFSLNNIPAGTGESQRIGRKAVLRSFGIRFKIQLKSSASLLPNAVRFMLVLDKQANGTKALDSEILDNGVTQDFFAFNRLSNKNRFRTLVDRMYAFNRTAGVVAASADNLILDFVYKKLDIPVEFSGTTGVDTEIRSNNLLMVLFVEDIIGTADCEFQAISRLRFTDN